jgi:hypothetical protein
LVYGNDRRKMAGKSSDGVVRGISIPEDEGATFLRYYTMRG